METSNKHRQLFILADEVWDSMSFDDVEATITDMVEIGLDKPPCAEFDILTKMHVVDRIHKHVIGDDDLLGTHHYHKEMIWRFTYDGEDKEFQTHMLVPLDGSKNLKSFGDDWYNTKVKINDQLTEEEKTIELDELNIWIKSNSRWVANYLLVALAAKNAVKTTKENKLAKLGIGKKNPKNSYAYTTTISIGKITETTEGEGGSGGWTVRPHLRRGHIREQRYGPNNQYSKKVFIQPVFVNASGDFINFRAAYNVKVA